MGHIGKKKQMVCTLIVSVFMLVTVFEPITAVAAETGSQETQTQEQQQEQTKDQSLLENQKQNESAEPESLQKEDVQQTAIVLDDPIIEKWTRVSTTSMKLTWKKNRGGSRRL